ncbi:MAG: hypothetical protein ACO3VL_05775 [Ilumatobacteraceae bacterium]
MAISFGSGTSSVSAGFFVATAPPVDDTIPDEQGGGSVIDDSIPTIDPVTQTTLPAGCVAPRAATATFLGELISSDDLLATYRVVQVRGGSLGAYVNSGLISVRYADRETLFLEPGKIYLVGAGASELFTTLESKVRSEKELFGGDAVVGIDESDVPCPKFEDPIITLLPSGDFIDSGVLSLISSEPTQLLQVFLLPLFFVLVFLIGLVFIKRLIQAARRSSR